MSDQQDGVLSLKAAVKVCLGKTKSVIVAGALQHYVSWSKLDLHEFLFCFILILIVYSGPIWKIEVLVRCPCAGLTEETRDTCVSYKSSSLCAFLFYY